MSDYIKREDETGYIKKADAIRTALRESTECVTSDEYTEADSARVGEVVARVIYALQTIPSADVAPVRHGRWIVDGEPPMLVIKCSECGQKYFNHAMQDFANYCSNCGAKMEGGSNE